MSDSGAASIAPTTSQPSAEAGIDHSKDTKDWTHKEPQGEKSSPEPRTAPRKESPTSGKPHTAKPAAPKPAAKPEVDEDPDEEWDDDNGGKVKAKRSELRAAYARKAEIERASHDKFQKGAEARKAAEAKEAEFVKLTNALEQDPWAIHRYRLMQGGLSAEQADSKLNELAEARLVTQMKRAQMTPEQVEHERVTARLKELEDGEVKRTEEAKTARQTELKTKHKENWDRQIGEAMTEANLARTRATAARVARVLADHFDPETGKSIEPALAARIARDQHHTEVRHELTELLASNPRAAIELIGPQLVKAIIEHQAQEHKEFIPQARPSPQSPKPKQPTRQGPPTFEDARKSLGIKRF